MLRFTWSVHVSYVVVHREHVLEVTFAWEDVDHPGKQY
jgi:hypothetical protein